MFRCDRRAWSRQHPLISLSLFVFFGWFGLVWNGIVFLVGLCDCVIDIDGRCLESNGIEWNRFSIST